ncbi:MAG: hypothetical protein WAU70_06410 [Flavobacteriales bacterium]
MKVLMEKAGCFSASIALLLGMGTVQGQPGALDTSFDGDGIVTMDLGSLDDEAEAVVVQPDGKIVVAGYSGDGLDVNIAVLRFNPDGTPDAIFGNGGVVITDIDSSYQIALDVTLDGEGRILACGWTVVPGGSYDMVVLRYLADGTLDSGFGIGGIVTTAVGAPGETEQAYALVVQPDGRIVVAGAATDSNQDRFCVVRYLSDGTLDPAFSGDGIQITPMVPTWPGLAHGVAIQPDGKIIAVGWSNGFALARYTTTGDLDITFGNNGTVTTGVAGLAYDVVVQPDGKILVPGAIGGGNFSCVTARYNEDGTLDSGFGVNGQAITLVNTSSIADAVLYQPDGKIVVSGYSGIGFLVLRYTANGTLDASFGNAGVVTTILAPQGAIAFGSALQSNGRILVCGRTTTGTNTDLAVVRYLTGLEVGAVDLDAGTVATLVYPDPIGETATLEFELHDAGSLSCALHDAEGRSVRSFFFTREHPAGKQCTTLDLSGIAAGNYLLVLDQGDRRTSVQVVKQ